MQHTWIAWLEQKSEDFQFVLFFGLLAFFIFWELVSPFRAAREGRKKRWPANFLLTVLNVLVLGMLPVTFMGAAWYAGGHGIGLLNWAALPLPVLLPAALLLRGFISFFIHFLMHKIPVFWRLHRVHHLDTEMDVSTTVRFHPLEFVGNLLVGIPLVLLFGLPVWTLLLYELLDVAVTLFSHANIRLPARLERILCYVIVTPDLHRVHHSTLQPETDSNFGAVFPIWDLVFGTFRTETRQRQEDMALGLTEVRDARTRRFGWLLISPIVSFPKEEKTRGKEASQTTDGN
jgi:sterol desaturase/sphingolipid hydroxylase (fatty acid hydroxylase superfamily)